MTEMVSLEERRLLSPLRGDLPAPAAARERVRERLAAVIPGMGLGALLQGSAPSVPAPEPSRTCARIDGVGEAERVLEAPPFARGAVRSGRLPGLPFVTFVIGAVTGAALYATLARPVRVAVSEPAPAVAAQMPPSGAVAARAPSAAAPQPVAPLRELARDARGDVAEEVSAALPTSKSRLEAPRLVPSVGGARVSQLALERGILDGARARLLEGEPARALAQLERHQARFPRGTLSEEREAMRVEALVGAHRYGEARAAALAFKAALPKSLFLPMVDSAIASIP